MMVSRHSWIAILDVSQLIGLKRFCYASPIRFHSRGGVREHVCLILNICYAEGTQEYLKECSKT